MAKYTVLEHSRRFISLIFRIDDEERQEQTQNGIIGKTFRSIPVYLNIFIICVIILSTSIRVFATSHDFTTKLTAAALLISECQCLAIFMNMGLNMQKITEFHQTLQYFVNGEGIANHSDILFYIS